MHIGKTQVQHPYYMNSWQLEVVDKEKDLGIIITNDLKVLQQCQLAVSKASRIWDL